MSGLTEQEVINRLRGAFPDSGIGDDTAVLPPVEGEVLFTTDAAVEGVHFDLSISTISQAVQKLVTSNVSDIYAMGGKPDAALVTAGLPRGCTIKNIDEIIDGLKRGCDAYGLQLVGGDTVLNPAGIFLNASVIGAVERERSVSRAGARGGELLVLFGTCGASLAGLLLLGATGEAGETAESYPTIDIPKSVNMKKTRSLAHRLHLSMNTAEIQQICTEGGEDESLAPVLSLCKQHMVPLAVPLDRALLEAEPPVITAMIDISDGIAKDLVTLCRESGVGAAVDEAALPVPPAIAAFFPDGLPSQTQIMLSSGEEYVLLAAVSESARALLPDSAAVIGTVVPETEGVTLVKRNGEKVPLPKLGYEHTF